MKSKVEFAPHLTIPRGPFKTAFIKGVMAAHEGKKEEDNPYKLSSGGYGAGFHYQWSRGYGCYKHGTAKVKENI